MWTGLLGIAKVTTDGEPSQVGAGTTNIVEPTNNSPDPPATRILNPGKETPQGNEDGGAKDTANMTRAPGACVPTGLWMPIPKVEPTEGMPLARNMLPGGLAPQP